ncbi:SPOSA6832_00428, partial [Sporobolomyces salmonicolor]
MTSKSPVTSAPSSASSSAFADRLHSPSGPQDRLIRSDSLGAGLGLSVVREAPVGRSEGEGEGEAHEGAAPAPELQQQHQLEPLSSPNSAAPTYESEAPTYATTEEREGEGEIDEGQPHQRKSAKTAALDLYFSRDDMIDKFLYAAVTGNDEQYVTLFLITYRRFARPYDVLEKLIERFEFVAGRLKTDPLLSRFAQMKICGVLSTWMQNYPGDFTSPTTFGVVQPFLESLLPRGATWVAHYALDLLPLLASISAQSDPDGAWALPDKPLTEVNLPTSTGDPVRPAPAPRRPSLAPSYDSTSSIAPSTYMQASGMHRAALSVPGSVGTADSSGPHASSLSPRPASEAGTLDTQDSSEQSQSFGGSTASLRSKNPTSSMLVDVSNAIMELREEDIAMQITRLAWKLFSGMTPRDLLRHVLAPRDPANPRVALRDSESNVMRSIAFINVSTALARAAGPRLTLPPVLQYLASWTSTMILVQSKLKMRARIMEKMLLVALALREQENFDSLMGVLAGLNSQPIFRLSETMALVTAKLDGDAGKQPRRSEQPDGDKNKLPKKLRSLNRLMAATKSFSAYRLALANSGMNMIPYLCASLSFPLPRRPARKLIGRDFSSGVHLQDITVVNEIKSDLRDGKVNWSKFSQMGRSAAIVLDCARVAPALPVDRTIEKFIANVPIVDEEVCPVLSPLPEEHPLSRRFRLQRQYALSYAHQPRQSDKPVTTRSRLRTLAKSTFASASNNA